MEVEFIKLHPATAFAHWGQESSGTRGHRFDTTREAGADNCLSDIIELRLKLVYGPRLGPKKPEGFLLT